MRYHPIVRRMDLEGIGSALIHRPPPSRALIARFYRALRAEGQPREVIRGAQVYVAWVGYPSSLSR